MRRLSLSIPVCRWIPSLLLAAALGGCGLGDDHDNAQERLASGDRTAPKARIDRFGRIGRLLPDGRQPAFSSIVDMAVDSLGFWILDDAGLTLSRFDRAGQYVASTTGAAAGRSAFGWPVQLEVLQGASPRAYVLDLEAGSLRQFVLSTAALVESDPIPVPDGTTSFCIAGATILVLTPGDSTLLRQIDAYGSETRRYAASAPYSRDSVSGPFTGILHDAHLVCLPDRRMAVIVPRYAGRVTAVDTVGAVVWSRDLSDFVERQWVFNTDPEKGRLGYASYTDSSYGYSDQIVAASILEPGVISLIVVRERPSMVLESATVARMLDVATGEEIGEVSLPSGSRLVDHDGDTYFGFALTPFPQVVSFTLEAS